MEKIKVKRVKATFQTRLDDHPFLQDFANLYNQIQRKLYVDLYKKDTKKTNVDYLKTYKISSRHYNSILYDLKQKVNTRQGNINYYKKLLTIKVKKLNKRLKKQTDNKQIHYLKRKIQVTQDKLNNIKFNIIFGGKKLWEQRNNTEEWKKAWHQARHNQFTFMGAKAENYGNLNCQLNGSKLCIRVPEALEHKYGQHVILENIKFTYGQEIINFATKTEPMFYRFVKKPKGWYLFATTNIPDQTIISDKANGALGIDINPRLIGYTICDKEGNLKYSNQRSFNIGRQNQTKANLSKIVIEIVNLAVKYKVPIVIENLDFCRKKVDAKGKHARMLNGFAYNLFKTLLIARAQKKGIKVNYRNPAYSSIIGLVKFMSLYGLNSATAAALVIARRYLRLSERIPTNSTGGKPVEMPLHVWSYWSKFLKKSSNLRRHSFFDRGANSPTKVILLSGVSELKGKPRRGVLVCK